MIAGQDAGLAEEDLTAMWSGFRTGILKPITKLHIPFSFTLGNHDASPSFPIDRKLTQDFGSNKKRQPYTSHICRQYLYPFYFSYIKNNVCFISWDADGAVVPEIIQQWMITQLHSRIAQHARMQIVLGHLPLFPIVKKNNASVEYIGNIGLEFFKSHGVALYISGQQHAYYPADKNGVELLNAGCSGQRQYLNSNAEAAKAYTLLTIPAEKPTPFSYETYNPQTYPLIPITSLPSSITGIAGTILRRDTKTND